ncbi:unnamed protein product [Polarella glacialis]|uniref:Adenylate kinase n=1 Tax=Polarella glacialis TaxID=89957 RepID=A0A813KVH1_POLGL|nr:unnamed protein product [Polarella glacialis]|mmetsp:Transcript_74368/g.134023  ORF Transcript_74368/g.134023 Transcript_74368/m.134023 type:complete len:327 (+) Transcript_74368:73-1053(+)
MAAMGNSRRQRRAAGAATLTGAVCVATRFAADSPVFTVAPMSGTLSSSGASVTGLEATAPSVEFKVQGASSASSVGASGVALAFTAAAAVGLGASRHGLESVQRRRCRTACAARGGGAKGAIVVIAGPPAAGKGTQCEKIKEKYGYVHISTGDILRENVKNGTALGIKAKAFMDSGALVPSDLIVDLVKDRLTKDDVKEKGCLLDGFPRAPDQALALVEAGINIQRFLLIKVPDETLVERGCGRRLDPQNGEIYHLKFRPPPADIVDRLVHRSDDQEEAIRVRLGNYHSQIDGITPYFKDAVFEIDGTGKPDDVFKLVTEGLDSIP